MLSHCIDLFALHRTQQARYVIVEQQQEQLQEISFRFYLPPLMIAMALAAFVVQMVNLSIKNVFACVRVCVLTSCTCACGASYQPQIHFNSLIRNVAR